MLGDTGSNAFGRGTGRGRGAVLFPVLAGCLVLLLVLFQVWCERHSLSKTIENHPVLRRLDRKIGVR